MADMNRDQIEDMMTCLRDISIDQSRAADALEKIANDIGAIATILNQMAIKETN